MLKRDRGSEGVSMSFRFVLCGLVFTAAGIVSTQAQGKGEDRRALERLCRRYANRTLFWKSDPAIVPIQSMAIITGR